MSGGIIEARCSDKRGGFPGKIFEWVNNLATREYVVLHAQWVTVTPVSVPRHQGVSSACSGKGRVRTWLFGSNDGRIPGAYHCLYERSVEPFKACPNKFSACKRIVLIHLSKVHPLNEFLVAMLNYLNTSRQNMFPYHDSIPKWWKRPPNNSMPFYSIRSDVIDSRWRPTKLKVYCVGWIVHHTRLVHKQQQHMPHSEQGQPISYVILWIKPFIQF